MGDKIKENEEMMKTKGKDKGEKVREQEREEKETGKSKLMQW